MLTLFLLQSQSWGCDTDMFEPNNSQTQSTSISDGTYTSLIVCEADDDWYSFETCFSFQYWKDDHETFLQLA